MSNADAPSAHHQHRKEKTMYAATEIELIARHVMRERRQQVPSTRRARRAR